MNSMRTGNIIFDTLVCMLIPILFGGIATTMQSGPHHLRRAMDKFLARNQVVRTITYEKKTNQWGYTISTSNDDHLLQKAIMMYVADNDPGKKLHKHATGGELHRGEAEVDEAVAHVAEVEVGGEAVAHHPWQRVEPARLLGEIKRRVGEAGLEEVGGERVAHVT